jgi:hypothetical protein
MSNESKLQIDMYLKCKKCFEELPVGTSMQEFATTQAGFTTTGIQVWCTRHNCEVVHLPYKQER